MGEVGTFPDRLLGSLKSRFTEIYWCPFDIKIQKFTQKYTFPVTIESAVVTYLDCEHYIFLHKTHEVSYKILSISNNKCVSEIIYKSGIFKWVQKSTTEYINKNEL